MNLLPILIMWHVAIVMFLYKMNQLIPPYFVIDVRAKLKARLCLVTGVLMKLTVFRTRDRPNFIGLGGR